MSLSRRQFIQASGVALCAGAVPLKAQAAGQQPALPVPPLLESRRGQPLFLTLQRAHWSFSQGTRAQVWGVNGRYLGPTIRVWNGDDVKLIYSNRLTENVAMTVRGLSARTIECYTDSIARLSRHFGGVNPARLSPEQIEAYLLHLVKDRHLS